MARIFTIAKFAGALPLMACCQTPVAPPSFEVAVVKPSMPGGTLSGAALPGGSISLRNLTMKLLIAGAWSVGDYAITGGPNWLDSDRFDVIAKAAPQSSTENIKLMLQTLLVERFKLAVHRDQKVMSVYALVRGKRDPKLKPALENPDPAGCRGSREGGLAHRTCHDVTMDSFVQILPGLAPHYIDLPIVNLTGLTGKYDFTLAWTPVQLLHSPSRSGNPGTTMDRDVISIFDAVETQLGLKLEHRRETCPVVVVDRIERIQADK
jgi:uncharacterized protein (TIGR03435 family)